MGPLSRRRFLKVGGVLGAALAAGSALLMRGGGGAWYRGLLEGARPTVLSEKELAVLLVLCDRFLPGGPASARALKIAERIDLELGFHHAKLVEDFKSALLLVEHGGVLHASATRFTRLSPEAQDARLAAMALDGAQVERMAASQLKLVSVFFYYCDERTWRDIHYDGPMAKRSAPPADSNPFGERAHG